LLLLLLLLAIISQPKREDIEHIRGDALPWHGPLLAE
jgi:hypothetical protein